MSFQQISHIFILLVFIERSYSLNCFICNQDGKGQLCSKDLGKLRNCDSVSMKEEILSLTSPEQQPVVRASLDKMKLTPKCAKFAISTSSSQTGYSRACLPAELAESACATYKALLKQHEDTQGQQTNVKCYFCDTDGCNGANLIKITPLITFFCVVILKLMN